jgi:catechol-2,3-dioxygenase
MAAPTVGLRHAVLWVSEPARSAEFYGDVLGLETKLASPDAVFMSSPASRTDHDLGLFRGVVPGPVERAASRRVGLYHLSWEVPTLADLAAVRQRLIELGAYVGENNHGMSRSVYAHDPDGIEFEVMWEVPVELMADDEPSNVPLDIDADIARFGADTPGRGA